MFVFIFSDTPPDDDRAIAGTHPLSVYDWIFLDGAINETHEWPYAPQGTPMSATPSQRPRLAKGTWVGLSNLLLIKDLTTSKTVVEFLHDTMSGLPAGSEAHVIVTGHSLGGALSPVMALYLHDNYKMWGSVAAPATVYCYALAGPTIGNAAMAEYPLRMAG